MELTASILLASAILLFSAIVLNVWHLQQWRAWQTVNLDAEDLDYRHRQFRRRMQTSTMLGLLGIALTAGHFLAGWFESPWSIMIYWTGTMLLAFWIGLLAVVDLLATRHHFARLQHRILLSRLKLEAEAERLRTVEGNGKPRGEKPPISADERR